MRGDAAIRQYINDCKVLRRELQHLVRDLEFRQQGGRIVYAVDFSEIFAYAVPGENAREFAILGDDERIAEAVQSLAFSRLFHNEPHPLVLLPPYALELQSFLLQQVHRTRESMFGDLLILQREQEAIMQLPEFAVVGEIVDGAEREQRELTDEEQARLTAFLEEHAGPLLALANTPTEPDAATRVRGLFMGDRFQNLDALVPGVESQEGELENTVYDALRGARRGTPEASSWIDAVALGMLSRANQALRPQNTQVHLVTRSVAMHRLAEEPGGEEIGFLRHPRVFSVLYTVEGVPTAQALEQLGSRLETVNLFLNSIGWSNLASVDKLPNTVFLEALLSKIQEDWRASSALAASLDAARARPARLDRQPDTIRRLFSLVRDRDGFRELLFERIREVDATLERDHELFGLYLSSLDSADSEPAGGRLAPDSLGGKTVLRTTTQAMPYRLHFETPAARRLLATLHGENGAYQWVDVLTFFREGFSATSDYERVLAMAVTLGALSKWNIAEQYCQRALEVAEATGAPAHEGLFLLAVCHRKSRMSPERHLEALRLLDRAIEVQRGARGDDAWVDARYVKEKATHILFLYQAGFDSAHHPGVPPHQEALALLDVADRHCPDDDLTLRLQILNNRLFFSVGSYVPGENPQIEADYRRLLETQAAVEPDRSAWPASVVDTLAWTRFNLYGVPTQEDGEELIEMLEQAAASHELEKTEKQRIRGHLKTVRHAAEARNTELVPAG